ncbi:hypothetical protein HQ584_02990 [Patescibacteria group bacterium]|nr:hypothetical protein [Patescibacteria group bacterium]
MQFNTTNDGESSQWNHYRDFEKKYLYSPAYSLWGKGSFIPKFDSYLETGLGTKPLLPDKPYLNTDMDPITGMIKQKSFLANHSLYSVIDQLYKRKNMLKDHLYEIDYAICRTDSYLFQLDGFPIGVSPAAEKRRGALENLVQSLEQEKRREEINAFGDFHLLSKDLNEALTGYLSAKRTEGLFKDASQGT